MEVNDGMTCCGFLPAKAPLANPYVPFQPSNPPRYEARRGLIRGTLFPCLDLPFMDMVNEAELSDTPLHELQALAFAIQELGQYLDTHGEDGDAAELYQQYAELYRNGMEQYQTRCGALRQTDSVKNGKYTWINAPWPWELAANQED